MIKKQYIKSRKVSKVTFALPKAELPEGIEPENVHLADVLYQWDGGSAVESEDSGALNYLEVVNQPMIVP